MVMVASCCGGSLTGQESYLELMEEEPVRTEITTPVLLLLCLLCDYALLCVALSENMLVVVT